MRVDSAENWDHVDLEHLSELGRNLVNLLAQLSGWREDDGDGSIASLQLRLLEHVR